MGESNDESRIPLPPRERRPPPVGHVWAWIVVAIAVVIFMVITLWMVAGGQEAPQVQALSDREVIFRHAQRWRERWPQVPGPPEVYVREAMAALERGDLDTAARRTTMGLALDPDDSDAWLRLIVLSCQDPPPALTLTHREAQEVMVALGQQGEPSEALTTAMGWMALASGDADRALASVGVEPGDLGGRWLRWKALRGRVAPTDLDAVLEVAPAHTGACVARIRMAVDAGDPVAAQQVGMVCVDAGADAGQVDDLLGKIDTPTTSEASGDQTPDSLGTVEN